MKTREEREQELQAMATSETGRQAVIQLWKRYQHEDPGHWQPAEGWDYAALIRGILQHEYHRSR